MTREAYDAAVDSGEVIVAHSVRARIPKDDLDHEIERVLTLTA